MARVHVGKKVGNMYVGVSKSISSQRVLDQTGRDMDDKSLPMAARILSGIAHIFILLVTLVVFGGIAAFLIYLFCSI